MKGDILGLGLSDITGSEPTVVWDKELTTSTSGGLFTCGASVSKPMSTYGVPAIGGGEGEEKVYIGGYDGRVYAIRIDDRSMNIFDTGEAIVGSPKIAGDLLFVGNSAGELYALDLQLKEKWPEPFEAGDKIWATPEVHNGVVYIGSADHNLYAVDIETGGEIWHFETQGAVFSTPLIVNDTVYIGSCDSKFYAIDAVSGEMKWEFTGASNWFWTQALFYQGEVWVGCLDHWLYVLNADTGEKTGEFETGGMIQSPPVLIGGVIVVGSGADEGEERGQLYTIDPEERTLAPLRSFEAPVLAPLWADSDRGLVYVHAQNGKHVLYAIRVETGEQLWSYQTN